MKKLLLIGVCCLCLCGCGKKEEINYDIKVKHGSIYIYKNAVLHFKGTLINNSDVDCEYTDVYILLSNGKIEKEGEITLGKTKAHSITEFDDYVWFIDVEEINNINNYEYEVTKIKCTPYKTN